MQLGWVIRFGHELKAGLIIIFKNLGSICHLLKFKGQIIRG